MVSFSSNLLLLHFSLALLAFFWGFQYQQSQQPLFSYDAHSTFLIWGMPLQGFILPRFLFLCTPSGLSLDRNSNMNNYGHKSPIFSPPRQGKTRLQPWRKEQHWDSALWGTLVCWGDEGISDGVWDGSYCLKWELIPIPHTHKQTNFNKQNKPPKKAKTNFSVLRLVSD